MQYQHRQNVCPRARQTESRARLRESREEDHGDLARSGQADHSTESGCSWTSARVGSLIAQPRPRGPAPPAGPGVRFVSSLHAGIRPDAHAWTMKHSQAVDPGYRATDVVYEYERASVYLMQGGPSQACGGAQMKPQVHQNLSRQTLI